MYIFRANNPTPQQLSLLTAANIAGTVLGVLVLVKLIFYNSISWGLVISIPFLVLGVAVASVSEGLKKFIYRKVKLIYKSIHSLKAPKTASEMDIDMGAHIIDEVEEEVIEWAKDWTKQIRNLKKMETFRRDFMGNVSHELKTPIFSIQGYLYTLLDGGMEDPHILKKYLEKAVDNVERMAAIVSDLGTISKLESDEMPLKMTRFNICVLAQEVVDDMELTAQQQKNIIVGLKEATVRPFFVKADKEMIRRVLINLIANSIKYGREGGSTLLGFYDLDKHILLEVTDDGKGIAQEHLPRLFERFYRVDNARSREEGGSGLGLSIVKHIIEAHQQTINVRSREGVGSTFGFTLKKA